MSKFMSLKELANHLGKSENSIRHHLRMGRIRPTYKLGRSMMFDPELVLKQLQRDIRHK